MRSIRFKQLPIIDGRFYINGLGQIYNTKLGRFVSTYLGSNGYCYFRTLYNGKCYRYSVHRLVASAFCENPNNYPVVMHLDSNRTNCVYTNLKWGTYSENNRQSFLEGHNIPPRPDNRKSYILYNDTESIEFYGLDSLIDYIGYTNDSSARNYIHRNTEITSGRYKGYKIRLKD